MGCKRLPVLAQTPAPASPWSSSWRRQGISAMKDSGGEIGQADLEQAGFSAGFPDAAGDAVQRGGHRRGRCGRGPRRRAQGGRRSGG